MAWDDGLSSIARAEGRSVTQQLVDLIAAAVSSGELQPGERLPPVRALAARAGINQLTATRVYRRLQEMGLLVATVGRGTFVREGADVTQPDAADDCSWQLYTLAPSRNGKSPRHMAAAIANGLGEDVVSFSRGALAEEFIPIDALAEAGMAILRDGDPETFALASVEGEWSLREQLAGLAGEHGHRDGPDQIVVTTGASQALTIAARTLLRAGDVAACESPSFAGIIDALNATGARVLPVPVDELGLQVDALETILRSAEIKVLALQPRVQNPTGYDLDGERAERLLALARSHGFFILEDAVYAPLRFKHEPSVPLRALDPAHVIHVNSLSKTLSSGLRIGWLAASGPVLDQLVAEKNEADMTSPTITQRLAARYLSSGRQRALLADAVPVYRERRDVMLEALDRHMSGLAEWTRPSGGGHLWLTLRRPRSEEALYRSALDAGVSYLPGSAALVEAPAATHMRISFGGCPTDRIEEGVHRLAHAVRAQPQAAHRETQPGA